MRSIALASSIVVTACLLSTSEASAVNFEQVYFRDDGTVLLQIHFNGAITKRSNVSWDARRTSKGELYYQCRYRAKNAAGQVVNEQILYYFGDDPVDGNTDASNHWVYWYSVKSEVIWGRCPTKKHPNYRQWLAAKGPDLWQVVPKAARPALKGELRISTVGPRFALEVIGLNDEAMPKVEPATANDAILCIDIGNAIFS